MTRFNARARILVVAVVVGLALAAGGTAVAVSPQSEATAPMTVSTQYVGNTTSANHAFNVRITVAPAENTLTSTEIDIQSTQHGFISTESIDQIVSTNDGRQVVTQGDGEPLHFQIDRLEPGETVTIEVLVYPKEIIPDGESLATVDVRTQFDANQRVVNAESVVAPDLSPEAVSVVATSGPSPVMAGVGGAIGGIIATGGLALVLWWRRKSRIQYLGQAIVSSAVSTETQQRARELLKVVGSAETNHHQDHHDNPEIEDTTTDSEDGSAAEIELVDDLD